MSIVAYVLEVIIVVVVIRGVLSLIDLERCARKGWPDPPPDVPGARIGRR